MWWLYCRTQANATSPPGSSIKQQTLKNILSNLSPVAVAFSGGVDSSLLLKVAFDTLQERCVAITVDAPYHFRDELHDAKAIANAIGVRHLFIPFDPSTIPNLMDNPPDRCYLCKKAILALCLSTLPSPPWTFVDGSTADDLTAHRPGRKALEELGVRSPLAEAGFTKQDIRNLSHELGLPTWDKPAQSCLLTRFPHEIRITLEELAKVENCEDKIRKLGIKTVRLRTTGNYAKIECDEMEQAETMFREIEAICKALGFKTVELHHASTDGIPPF